MPKEWWEKGLVELVEGEKERKPPESLVKTQYDQQLLQWLQGHIGDCFAFDNGLRWCIVSDSSMPDGIRVEEHYSFMRGAEEAEDVLPWPWKDFFAKYRWVTPEELERLDTQTTQAKLVTRHEAGEELTPEEQKTLQDIGYPPAEPVAPTLMPEGVDWGDAASVADYYASPQGQSMLQQLGILPVSPLEQYFPFTAGWGDDMKAWGEAALADTSPPPAGFDEGSWKEYVLTEADKMMRAGVPARGIWEQLAGQRRYTEEQAKIETAGQMEPSKWYEQQQLLEPFGGIGGGRPATDTWPDYWRTSRGAPTRQEEWATDIFRRAGEGGWNPWPLMASPQALGTLFNTKTQMGMQQAGYPEWAMAAPSQGGLSHAWAKGYTWPEVQSWGSFMRGRL